MFKQKKKEITQMAQAAPAMSVVPVVQGVVVESSLLQKEREKLLQEQKVLADLQNQIHAQHDRISHCRENISLLEDHPWFESLYVELRKREQAA